MHPGRRAQRADHGDVQEHRPRRRQPAALIDAEADLPLPDVSPQNGNGDLLLRAGVATADRPWSAPRGTGAAGVAQAGGGPHSLPVGVGGAGESTTLVFEVAEPATEGDISTFVTPLVKPATGVPTPGSAAPTAASGPYAARLGKSMTVPAFGGFTRIIRMLGEHSGSATRWGCGVFGTKTLRRGMALTAAVAVLAMPIGMAPANAETDYPPGFYQITATSFNARLVAP